jgi:hypothetical protein
VRIHSGFENPVVPTKETSSRQEKPSEEIGRESVFENLPDHSYRPKGNWTREIIDMQYIDLDPGEHEKKRKREADIRADVAKQKAIRSTEMRDLEIKDMRAARASRERYEARDWRWKTEFAQAQELLREMEETNERQERGGGGPTSTLPVQISALAPIPKRANTQKVVSVPNRTPVGTVKSIVTVPPPKSAKYNQGDGLPVEIRLSASESESL